MYVYVYEMKFEFADDTLYSNYNSLFFFIFVVSKVTTVTLNVSDN